MSNAWTPGTQLGLPTHYNITRAEWQYAWKNVTLPRSQDSFQRRANQPCSIANVTVSANSNMTVWKGNKESQYHMVVSSSPPINFIFKTKVNVTCCSVNISIHSNTYTSFVASILQTVQYCNNSKHNLN